MLIQCLIVREGNRHIVRLERWRYKFERNEKGDMVCEVSNQEHIRWMLMSSNYQAYAVSEAFQQLSQIKSPRKETVEDALDEFFEPPTLKTPIHELAGLPIPGKKAKNNQKRKAA